VSKLERLMNLTALLLDTEHPILASEIQREVPGYPDSPTAFRRAFERDKDDLREMGIPISVEPTPEVEPPIDGYRIYKHDYYLDDPGLEPDELAAIHLATRAVRFEGGSSAEALRKLGGVEATRSSGEELAAIPASPHLTRLFGALGDRRLVGFSYSDVARSVEPRRLDFLRGRWYLSGFDRGRQAERHFRLDRIQGEVVVSDEETYQQEPQASPGIRLEPWQLGDAEPVRVKLLVDAGWADEARKRVGSEAEVETTPAGASIFEIPVSNLDGFRSFVIGFLDHAEVIEPAAVRAAMVDWLTAVTRR
jgi:proteasome accessory factor B